MYLQWQEILTYRSVWQYEHSHWLEFMIIVLHFGFRGSLMRYTCIIAFSLVGSSNPVQQSSPQSSPAIRDDQNYQYCLDKLRVQTLNMRSFLKQCHLYKLVHGLSIFPNSPITTSSSHSYPTHSNHNLSPHVPSCHTNAYYYSFFVMPYIPGTHYLILFHP